MFSSTNYFRYERVDLLYISFVHTMKSNHLAKESSPYLKQHARNPVDWYPWGEEALSRAKNEDKPIIVSIGYSTCHWCHVMERESFENESIAEVMNAYFICIKVDREERPDVDQVYMDAVGAMGQQGGWPLNVFLTPDKKPFYGGTYFPPDGWVALLENVKNVFHTKRNELEDSAEKVTESIGKSTFGGSFQIGGLNIDDNTFKGISEKVRNSFDTINGGTSGAPKFPMPAIWDFLAQSLSQNHDVEYSKQLLLTLDKMVFGGIYDQIGGGFARYSTDNKWFAPHFEKMLYDNGQLLSVYSKAYKIEPKIQYKEAVYQSVEWLKREMLDRKGGFYSALDADSEGQEGKFYIWTDTELADQLGEADYNLVKKYYNTTAAGNWEKGWNILYRNIDDESFAEANGFEPDELKQKINSINQTLLDIRSTRVRPGLDDKILLGWNALMSSGLIQAYKTFEEENFLKLAQRNVDFMLEEMCDGNMLYHSFGKTIQGYMDDYALFIEVLIELYQVTFNEHYLNRANDLSHYAISSFYDDKEYSFYFTSRDSEKLIVDKKEIFDNVIPASNSVMAKNLLKLGTMLDNAGYIKIVESMLQQVYKLVTQQPHYMANWASVFHLYHYAPYEIIIVGTQAHEMRGALSKMKLPNHILMGTTSESNLSLLEGRIAVDGKTTIYVCQKKTCQLPVFSVEEALGQIFEKKFA